MVLMYVPLLFKTQGPVASGKMALTMNIVNMTAVLAGAWLVGRLTSITTFIAEKNGAKQICYLEIHFMYQFFSMYLVDC